MKAELAICSPVTLILIGSLAGCATQRAAPPPLLRLNAARCDAAPTLTAARKIAYDPKKRENETTVEITGTSPCFSDAAGSSLYAAYALPSPPAAYIVRVDSEPEGKTLLAPRVLLYGSDATLKREFSGKQIVFRGGDLSVIFRSHEDERYLVVASDPAVVGHDISRVRDATHTAMAPVYPYYFYIYTGTDVTVKNTLSDNGRVSISLEPLASK